MDSPAESPAGGLSEGPVRCPREALLIDKAQLLSLTAQEMIALIGGLRMLNAGTKQNPQGAFTHKPEALTNEFFRDHARHGHGMENGVGRLRTWSRGVTARAVN